MRVGLGFHYVDREGKPSARRGEPHGLLDRITRPRLLDDVRFRPDLALVRAQVHDADRWKPLVGAWT